MKKKVLKILAFLTALALITGIVLFSTALMGNPVSRFLARQTAVRHLKETYPGTDYYIEDVNYDFKTSGYYARISSPTSIDTRFTLYFDMLGHLKYDSYDQVAGGFVTARKEGGLVLINVFLIWMNFLSSLRMAEASASSMTR